jgi:hypothetical protein
MESKTGVGRRKAVALLTVGLLSLVVGRGESTAKKQPQAKTEWRKQIGGGTGS